MRSFYKALYMLPPASQRHFWMCLIFSIASAVSETVALTSILPFFQETLGIQNQISDVYWKLITNVFGESVNDKNRTTLAGIISLVLLTFSVIVRVINIFISNSFSHSQRHHISVAIFTKYIKLPFAQASEIDQSEIQNIILSEVDQVTDLVFVPLISVINSLMLLIMLTTALVIIDPLTAITALTFFILMYITVLFTTRSQLQKLGINRNIQNKKRFSVVRDYIENQKYMRFKEISEKSLSLFDKAAQSFSYNLYMNASIAQTPRYFIEFVTIGSLIAAGIYVTAASGNNDSQVIRMLPFIGLLGLASLRMLPAFQSLYHGISYLNFGQPALDNIDEFLHKNNHLLSETKKFPPCPEIQNISLKSITYSYSQNSPPILQDCDYTFKAGKSYAITGASGSGKSTLLDILLGLRMAEKGSVYINDLTIQTQDIDLQSRCGLVAQNPTILEGTVRDNLLFFAPNLKLNANNPILEMLKDPNADNDILQQFDRRLYPNSGLSGGQLQRLALARALLLKPNILFLDEATSALDKETAHRILTNLLNSFNGIIIHITHDHDLARIHDHTLLLTDGKIFSN